jgi:hypothetical protein
MEIMVVRGQRSDRPRRAPAAEGVAPYTNRPVVRISNLYATSWRGDPRHADPSALPEQLKFSRLEQFYRSSADQLPVVLHSDQFDCATVHCHRWHAGALTAGRLWLFLMPSGQVVVGLSLDVDCPLVDAIDLLEDCYYDDITIGGARVPTVAAEHARGCGVTVDSAAFTHEKHQMVFSRKLDVKNQADLIQRLVYRANLPFQPEFSAISYPGELNRRPNTVTAVGPYVSVFCGHQDYVENAAFVSAAQAVASAARLREIRNALYLELRRFSTAERAEDTRVRRRTLEQITDDLTRLELDLSVSVEAPADLRVLVPSLRVAEYHQAVYAALGMKDLAATASRMLRRLEATARSELTSIESIERRADEDRRLRWTVAIGFVSAVAIPIGLILAFFGINATQVESDRSMFDPAYTWLYLGVALLAATAVALALTLYVHQLRQQRKLRERPGRFPALALPPEIPVQRHPEQP